MITKLQVSGMTCGSCVSHVEHALKTVPGVVAATVDLRNETATVEGRADIQALLARVEAEGYRATVANG